MTLKYKFKDFKGVNEALNKTFNKMEEIKSDIKLDITVNKIKEAWIMSITMDKEIKLNFK
tara:strand:+ start:76082 stop:76261 length:180 start_codon:yes stop_codon:yes gene_type:complete